MRHCAGSLGSGDKNPSPVRKLSVQRGRWYLVTYKRTDLSISDLQISHYQKSNYKYRKGEN